MGKYRHVVVLKIADHMSEKEQSPSVLNKQKKVSEHKWIDSYVRDFTCDKRTNICIIHTKVVIILPNEVSP